MIKIFCIVILFSFSVTGCGDFAKQSTEKSKDGNNWGEMNWDRGKWE